MEDSERIRLKRYRRFSNLLANRQPIPAALVKEIHTKGCNLFFVLDAFGYSEHMAKKSYYKNAQTSLDELKEFVKKIAYAPNARSFKSLQKEAVKLVGKPITEES